MSDPFFTRSGVVTEALVDPADHMLASGFGVPPHLANCYFLETDAGLGGGVPTDNEKVTMLDRLEGQLRFAAATGRWHITTTRREPDRLVPGDVVALTGLHAESLTLTVGSDGDVFVVGAGVRAALSLMDARAYWLPASAVEAVVSSDLPDSGQLSELRLPERVCIVWLAAPVTLPSEAAPAGGSSTMEGVEDLEWPTEAAFRMLDLIRQRPYECRLEAVLLTADEEGHPADAVAWLVKAPHGEHPSRAMILGQPSVAGWRQLVVLLAAIVSWGDWQPPPDPPDIDIMEADRQTRRQLRKGKLRKLEEDGAFAGVRVLDARPRRRSRTDGTGTHASPLPHVRRGHFRRQPVGPREEGRREIRWIAPMWVNPDDAGRNVKRVYRLPPPP